MRSAVTIGNCIGRLWIVFYGEPALGDTHMVVGYVLVGAIAGLISSMVALLLGASLWLAFGL